MMGNVILYQLGTPLLAIRSSKGEEETHTVYEKWNSFSRVRVFGVPDLPMQPFGWGLSPNLPEGVTAKQLFLTIDGSALTAMTAFDGNLEPLEYLRFDVTN